MNIFIVMIALLGLPGAAAPAGVDLSPKTEQAFRDYVKKAQAAADARANGTETFLWADGTKDRLQRLHRGEVVTERTAGKKPVQVSEGLIHDWIGAVFIKGVTLAQTLALVQDYDRHKTIYPEVIDSRLKSREDDHFVIYLRLKKKKGITVVLDTLHDARYFRVDAYRVHSRSQTTSVREVENAGTPGEHVKEPRTGGGYMWFLNSYWRFAERDGGVYVECQAVSLSRGIPLVVRLMPFVPGIINGLPRESLEGTLAATRDALLKVTTGTTLP